jgi:hypothetical protein
MTDFGWNPGDRISLGTEFDVQESPDLGGIENLASLLGGMESDPGRCIVRGFAEGNDGQPMPRRSEGGPFRDCDRHWALFDFDGIPISSATWNDAVSAINAKESPKGDYDPRGRRSDRWRYALAMIGTEIRTRMPPCFRAAAYYIHLSAGAFLKAPRTANAHLWFWFERPVCTASLARYAAEHGGLFDRSLFRVTQPHFTSDPIFPGGRDFLPWRGMYIDALKKAVTLPDTVVDFATWQSQQDQIEAERRASAERAVLMASRSPRAASAKQRYAEAAAEAVLGELVEARPGDRHASIYIASCRVGALSPWIGDGYRKRLETIAEMTLPSDRKKEAFRTVADGWNRGACNPDDLAHVL